MWFLEMNVDLLLDSLYTIGNGTTDHVIRVIQKIKQN
jgi:hypothetical protein